MNRADVIRLGILAGFGFISFNDEYCDVVGLPRGTISSSNNVNVEQVEHLVALIEAATRKEVAEKLTDEQIEALVVWKGDPKDPHYSRIEHARAIEAETLKAHQQAIEAAVLREREACAELCDSMKTTRLPDGDDDVERGFNGGLRRASSYIRARTQLIRIEDAHKEDGHGQSST